MKPLLACGALAIAASFTPCSATAALDIAGLDRSADPCADFYAFANRRWVDSVEIPKDQSRWGAFDELDQRNKRILVAALDEAMGAPPPASTAQGKVVRYYASGMDVAAIDKAGLKPIAETLARADAVVDPAGLAATLAYLHQRGIQAGFAFLVRPDEKDSTRYLAQVAQDGLGLPDRDDYFREDARSAQIRDAYRKHVARTFELAGTDAAAAQRLAAQVWDMETMLAKASMTAVERRDVDKTYNKMTVAQLEQAAPGFPWRAYFAATRCTCAPTPRSSCAARAAIRATRRSNGSTATRARHGWWTAPPRCTSRCWRATSWRNAATSGAGAEPPRQIRYSSATGTQLQNRLRSPYTLSARPTGTQYFALRSEATG